MKKLLYILFALFFSFCSTEKKSKVVDTQIESEIEIGKDSACKCIDTSIFTNSNFIPPFNLSTKIILFDFEYDITSVNSTTIWNDYLKNNHLNRNDTSFKITKELTLTRENIIEMQQILYNRIEKCFTNNYFSNAYDCAYNPHQCVVFYDKDNKPIDFLEICFICDSYRNSRKYYHGSFCGKTFCDLRNLFIKIGLEKQSINFEQCE